MALTRTEKEAIVADVAAAAARTGALVAAEYRGLGVAELTDLRRQARACGVRVRVVKNRLARRAFAGTGLECAGAELRGPLLFGFAEEEPAAAARLFRDFGAEHELLELKFGVFEGALLDRAGLGRLARMPSREQALAMLLATMRAPIEKLARTQAEIPARLARTLAAVRARREAAA